MNEIEQLAARLEAAERKIEILTQTLETLKNMKTSEQINTFLESQTKLLRQARFLNSLSDSEKLDIEGQEKYSEQLSQQKRELDQRINSAYAQSLGQIQGLGNVKVAGALDKWRSGQSDSELQNTLKCLSYRTEGNGITITAYRPQYDFSGAAVIPGNLRLPDEIDGNPVTKIAAGAFRGVRITNITLPSQLEFIGANAFSACHIKEIIFPDTLEEIGNGAFASCDFREIHLEHTRLHYIPENCFGWCGALKKLIFPETLQSIQNNAFVECTSLKSLIIPESARQVISPFSNSTIERRIAVLGMNTEVSGLCGISFTGSSSEITVYCLPDSKAQRCCLNEGISCRNLTEFIEQ